jgi:hypothetical protein
VFNGEAIEGAYWTKATFELMRNMPNPGTARSGYELRFTEPTANAGVYTANFRGAQLPPFGGTFLVQAGYR